MHLLSHLLPWEEAGGCWGLFVSQVRNPGFRGGGTGLVPPPQHTDSCTYSEVTHPHVHTFMHVCIRSVAHAGTGAGDAVSQGLWWWLASGWHPAERRLCPSLARHAHLLSVSVRASLGKACCIISAPPPSSRSKETVQGGRLAPRESGPRLSWSSPTTPAAIPALPHGPLPLAPDPQEIHALFSSDQKIAAAAGSCETPDPPQQASPSGAGQ